MSEGSPRPQSLSAVDIPDEVKAVRETEDIFRVYLTEWTVVHTVTGVGHDLFPFVDEARKYFEAHYLGRVRPEDANIDAQVADNRMFTVHVQLRRPNLKGEFKTLETARQHVARQGWDDAEIVVRNSKRDHDIRSYGVKKLS